MENVIVGHGPNYKLHETETDIVLSVDAPLCKPADVTVLLDNRIITFEAPPYFLRLKLPCCVSEVQHEDNYDESTGVYTLLMKKRPSTKDDSDSDSDDSSVEGLSNYLAHTKLANDSTSLNYEKPSYGFLNMYSDKFGDYYTEFSQVVSLPDPDRTKPEDRKILRQKEEKEKWSEDHYLADLMEPEHMIPLFKYTCPWSSDRSVELNSEEEEIMSSIPKCDRLNESNLSADEKRTATCQMVDILLGYCYNKRTTEGDNTVESAWTINKLSSTLSWLEVFTSLKGVLISFYKRSITYPLYRNWELSKRIHADVVSLLRSGPVWVTRCLIETKELFDGSDNRHILNLLYVNQLCHYALSLTWEALSETAAELEKIEVEKTEAHEDLIVLEIAAKMALDEEEAEGEGIESSDVDDVTNRVSGLSVEPTSTSDTEDAGCSSSSSSSSSSPFFNGDPTTSSSD